MPSSVDASPSLASPSDASRSPSLPPAPPDPPAPAVPAAPAAPAIVVPAPPPEPDVAVDDAPPVPEVEPEVEPALPDVMDVELVVVLALEEPPLPDVSIGVFKGGVGWSLHPMPAVTAVIAPKASKCPRAHVRIVFIGWRNLAQSRTDPSSYTLGVMRRSTSGLGMSSVRSDGGSAHAAASRIRLSVRTFAASRHALVCL